MRGSVGWRRPADGGEARGTAVDWSDGGYGWAQRIRQINGFPIGFPQKMAGGVFEIIFLIDTYSSKFASRAGLLESLFALCKNACQFFKE